MTGWGIFAVYALGYVAMWRTLCFFFASDMAGTVPGREIDGESLAFGLIVGTFVASLWPVILAFLGMRKVYALRGQDINSLIIPRSQKRRIELDARERHIKSLERELGIK